MNKYQKQLNKHVKKKVKKNIEEFLAVHQTIQPRQCGKTSLRMINTFSIIEQLGILQSKGYYRWMRKVTKASIKKENKDYGN